MTGINDSYMTIDKESIY